MKLEPGTKVFIKHTRQIGTVKGENDDGLRIYVDIFTPSGVKTVSVLKVMIVVVKELIGLWPYLRELWNVIKSNRKKKLVILEDDDMKL
jgi:hypothetical protein